MLMHRDRSRDAAQATEDSPPLRGRPGKAAGGVEPLGRTSWSALRVSPTQPLSPADHGHLRWWVWTLMAAAFAMLIASCRAEPAANVSQSVPVRTAPSGLDLVPLSIQSANGRHAFTVEVARTSGEQSRGMMFRRAMGADDGMIFPFQPPRPASFWMRNTYLPLDIIFVRADGTIARIAANATPLSEESIAVGEPVASVLEIRGGRAAELGIAEGDRVDWRDP